MKTLAISATSPPLTPPQGTMLLLAAVLAACGGTAADVDSTSRSGTAEAPVTVELRTAALETAPVVIRATGSLEPVRKVSPGAKILGRIEWLAVREGERVEKGALLARLESRDLQAAVQQAEAAVRMAEATKENALAQRDRIEDLHSRGSVTDKNLEDAVAAYRVAEASLEQTRANRAAARVRLGYAEVTSPLAGWVVVKHLETGDMATPGAALFTLEDLSRVEVDVQVPESDVVGLEKGAPARVSVLGHEVKAAVDRIVPSADPASRTFSVRMILDNPDGTFKSGMFARVSFARGERQALRVPARALVTRGQLQGLFVAGEDGRVRLRWVRAGRQEDDAVEILSGLETGERYVAEPPPILTNGALYTETGR